MKTPITGAGILIVDDEEDLVEMLAYNLDKRGYKTTRACDGLEALEKIESERPELMILDIMMPNLDGWQLCPIIRRNHDVMIREMGILMLTARTMPEDRVHGLEIGADDYLIKPFALNELILRVEKLIEERRSVSRLREEVHSIRSSMEARESSLRNLAHDLKSPLISMGCTARRMLRRDPNEEMSGALRTIFDSSSHLNQWIDEAIFHQDPSKPERREQLKEVDMNSMVQHAIDLLKEIGAQKAIEVQFKKSTIPAIPCHEPSMHRAVVNLLSNALKFTQRAGKVEVSVSAYFGMKGSGVLEISVKDTGIGICEDDLEKIFQPSCRGKNASSEEGKGLGLPFVKEVVDQHGGKILVQSELNSGSTFSILLPIKGIIQSSRDEQMRHSGNLA